MKFFFDTPNVYYLPQYFSVVNELLHRGHECVFVLYGGFGVVEEDLPQEYHGKTKSAETRLDVVRLYLEAKPDWIFFGNSFDFLAELDEGTKTVQMGHGVGPKPSYYHKSSTPMTVRFIEGDLRLKKIKELYPEGNFVQVGFSKLDPIFNDTAVGVDLEKAGFDLNKKTILYAPTFYPSSIGLMSKSFPEDFKEYNVLIKAHSIIYQQKKYKAERKLLEYWGAFDNVFVGDVSEYSLLPFMKNADLLISEASSTLFEFAAVGRPVVICDFYKLRWSYRGPFKYRFERRFGRDNVIYKDLGAHARNYKELKRVVEFQLGHLDDYEDARVQYTADHVGPTDGKVAIRIADYLESYNR